MTMAEAAEIVRMRESSRAKQQDDLRSPEPYAGEVDDAGTYRNAYRGSEPNEHRMIITKTEE